jgi:hypothetical protein
VITFPRWTPVRVSWVDSFRGQFEWGPMEPAKLGVCTSVGMLRKNTAKSLTLVQSRDGVTNDVLSAITIPWCAVLSVTELVPFEATEEPPTDARADHPRSAPPCHW